MASTDGMNVLEEVGGDETSETAAAVPTSDWWTKFRRSKQLVVAVVFVAMMSDLIGMASIDPLLPAILTKMDHDATVAASGADDGGYSDATVNATDLRHGRLQSANVTETSRVESRVGYIIALKPATEMIANIIVGAVVAKVGHRLPMMGGCIFNTASTLGFAYAPNFTFLIVACVCQAIASSMSVVSGLALISSTFPDQTERSAAMSTAFGGLTLGLVLGYPYGSVSYQFFGRQIPFIGLAVLSLADGFFRLLIASPPSTDNPPEEEEANSVKVYCQLLRDPYIAVALLCNFAPSFALGVFLATGPAWMLSELNAAQWQIGCVIAFALFFQIGAQILTGRYSLHYGRWIFCMMGLWTYAVGLFIYPACGTIWMLIGPEILTRAGCGMVICVISPLLSYLVDIRHDSNYGEVFGLYTASYNMALMVGAVLSGYAIKYISFSLLYRSVGAFMVVVSFSTIAFRNPKPRNLDTEKATKRNYQSFSATESTDLHMIED